MASSHDPAVSVFPANVQSQNMGKESAMLLPSSPPANTVHIACTSSASAASSSSNPIEKNFPASSLPLSKAEAVAGGTTAVISSNKYVKLNVGGSLHYTTMGTLTKEDNMLRAMFSGRMVVLTDSEGWILIDRCGKHFSCILNYLRDSSIVLPDSRYEVAELLAEAKYYLIQGLISQCESALERKQMEADPICRVPIITSHREEQDLVRRTHKPIVKFMYNRGNNKYSYTNSSDDNMLKNIELFDKLSLRFNGRILFMKDIIGDEICVWSYYGHQRKVAEICCTSIVYATEKKQTKVEFPEARIYEETLNILLYEHDQRGHHHQHVVITTDPLPPPAPVANDPQQQQGNPRSHNCQSDDDLDGGGGGDLQQQQQRNSQHRVRRIHVNSNRPV